MSTMLKQRHIVLRKTVSKILEGDVTSDVIKPGERGQAKFISVMSVKSDVGALGHLVPHSSFQVRHCLLSYCCKSTHEMAPISALI